MRSFDVDSGLRFVRRAPRSTLSRRSDDDLPFLGDRDVVGRGLLLDTCVYIDQLRGLTPPAVEALVGTRQVYHSATAIQELVHAIGALDPKDPRSSRVATSIEMVLNEVLDHRVFTPDIDILCRAAVVAGVLCRLQGYGQDNKLRALHDCTLLLQAQKLGLTLLTANIVDFDYILQLLPTGRTLFYRTLATSGQA